MSVENTLEKMGVVRKKNAVKITPIAASGEQITRPELYRDHLCCRKRIYDIWKLLQQPADTHANPLKECRDILFQLCELRLFFGWVYAVTYYEETEGLPQGYKRAMDHLGHTYPET